MEILRNRFERKMISLNLDLTAISKLFRPTSQIEIAVRSHEIMVYHEISMGYHETSRSYMITELSCMYIMYDG